MYVCSKNYPDLKINLKKVKYSALMKQKKLKSNTHNFSVTNGSMSFQYLGIPMAHRRLRNYKWRRVIVKFEKSLVNKKET
jgi:hypothetical protein